jgi:hypothetical protein
MQVAASREGEFSASVSGEEEDGRVRLYRAYDSTGRLLYVGISLSALARLANHRSQSDWFAEVRRLEIEVFSNRELAEAAERQAVQAESPIHNRVRFISYPSGRPLVQDKPELRYVPVCDSTDTGEWNEVIQPRDDWWSTE